MTSIVLAAQAAQGSGMSMIIMMVAIFAIMWFFMIRPQQKKQKEIQKFHGTVKSVDLAKNTVDVKIARDVVVTVEKTSVYKDMASTIQK